MSFLEEGDFTGLGGEDILHDIDDQLIDFYSSENGFSDDCLMSEFDNTPSPEAEYQYGSAPASQLASAEPSQWTAYQSPTPPPFSQQTPQQLSSPQFPHQSHHHLQQQQSQHPPQHFQQQQQSFGYPQYSPPFQHQHHQQQQHHQQFPPQGGGRSMEFSNSSFSQGGWEVPKTDNNLRPLAPQVPNGQYLAAPPSPPPPPPKGHLTSMATPAPFNQAPVLPFLAPSLSDSETRQLTEESGGELRLIAPKPPSLPPADFHRRSTQKPPPDSISPVSPARRPRGRAKRRSTLKQEQKIKLQVTKEPCFLGGSELRDQLKILSDKCAASEAESMALKQRLNETESELAALRLRMQNFHGAPGETF